MKSGFERLRRLQLRAASAAEDERGFSLIELLVVMSLLAGVLGALVGPMITSQRVEQSDADYAAAQQGASTGLESMVSDIRQATAILSSGSSFVVMNATLDGTSQAVEFECDIAMPSNTNYDECVRTYAAEGATPPTPPATCATSYPAGTGCKVVVTNLQNGSQPVFSWGPDPNAPYYMTATVDVPASDGQSSELNHPIVFSDGTLMRNLNVGN